MKSSKIEKKARKTKTTKKTKKPTSSKEVKKTEEVEDIELVSNYLINPNLNKIDTDGSISAVFSRGKDREISIEKDGDNHIKIKLHNKKDTSPHPLQKSFTFFQLERILKTILK